jgi:hypothetical protein
VALRNSASDDRALEKGANHPLDSIDVVYWLAVRGREEAAISLEQVFSLIPVHLQEMATEAMVRDNVLLHGHGSLVIGGCGVA